MERGKLFCKFAHIFIFPLFPHIERGTFGFLGLVVPAVWQAQRGEKFSAVIVFPLATEESEKLDCSAILQSRARSTLPSSSRRRRPRRRRRRRAVNGHPWPACATKTLDFREKQKHKPPEHFGLCT